MVFLIISSSVFALFITLICFSGKIRREMTKKQQLRHMHRETVYVDEELEKSFY
ncbi:MAG: hypothetical protein R2876_04120 [Eubacteriales bacterium]